MTKATHPGSHFAPTWRFSVGSSVKGFVVGQGWAAAWALQAFLALKASESVDQNLSRWAELGTIVATNLLTAFTGLILSAVIYWFMWSRKASFAERRGGTVIVCGVLCYLAGSALKASRLLGFWNGWWLGPLAAGFIYAIGLGLYKVKTFSPKVTGKAKNRG